MGAIIQTTDFVGKHKITQDLYIDLQAYIDKYEPLYLINLLGVALYDLFLADVSATTYKPVTAKYLSIYNPVRQEDGTIHIIGEGMKEMLVGFIFFEFVRDYKYKVTRAGVLVNNSTENREAAWSEFNLHSRYNDAVRTYASIQWYIRDNSDDYPEFNGFAKRLTHWSC